MTLNERCAMTLNELRALADEFFEWPIAHNESTVTMTLALLFAQHVLQLREMHEKHEKHEKSLGTNEKSLGTNEKSLGAENSAGVDALRDAAQRQLDALGGYRREIGLLTGVPDEQPCDAEVATRAALEQQAEPVQEPVAWRYQDARGNYRYRGYVQGFDKEYSRLRPVALYTAPPQRKPLTEKEIDKISWTEPVAWMCPEDPERETAFAWKAGHCENCGEQRIPLYTALVQDQDPELSAALGWPGGISDPVLDRETLLQQVARLVERAHGIGEEK